jgi:hypothetical protein
MGPFLVGDSMEYKHTQTAPLHYLLHGIAIVMLLAAYLSGGHQLVALILAGTACVMILFALSFRSLTVTDEGQHLAIRYGPIPIFQKRIAYSDITCAEQGRSQ